MDPKTVLEAAEHVSSSFYGDRALLKDNETEWFYNLNDVASYIWDRLDGSHSIEEIALALTAEYEVEEDQARQDVLEFVSNLLDLGLVRVVGIPGEPSHEVAEAIA